MFYINVVSDPDKAQYLSDVLEGRTPHEPFDDALRARYKETASRLLAATGADGEALRMIAKQARSQVYSDEDYANADFGITPPRPTGYSSLEQQLS